MTVRKRPVESETGGQPLAKRANLANSDKNGLKAFLATSFNDLKGYEEAARERLVLAVKKRESEEIDLALQCCIRVIEDVGKEACIMIAQSPRNIELCLHSNLSQRVIGRTLELIASFLSHGIVPTINWTLVFDQADKFIPEFQSIVRNYLGTPGLYAKPITTILSTYLQSVNTVSSTKQSELLDLINEKVVQSEQMNKNAKMAIFKGMTLRHLAIVFQKTEDEELKDFIRNLLVKISSHEGGGAINVDLSTDDGNSNKHILQLVTRLKKNDDETHQLAALILAKREELMYKYFNEVNRSNITVFYLTLEKTVELDESENRKWFNGNVESMVTCIVKTAFAGLSHNELSTLCRTANFEYLAKWMIIFKPIFTRINQLMKRVRKDLKSEVRKEVVIRAQTVLPDVQAVQHLINRLHQALSADSKVDAKADSKDDSMNASKDASADLKDEACRTLLKSCFEYFEQLNEMDPTALAPLMIEKLFSRARHCTTSMHIAIRLMERRKSSVLFFKGKPSCYAELVSEFNKTNSDELKCAICDLLSSLVSVPLWSLLKDQTIIDEIGNISRQIINDSSSAKWLLNLKRLMADDDIESVIENAKLETEPKIALPKFVVSFGKKSDYFIEKCLSNLLGWLADDSPYGNIDRIIITLEETFSDKSELVEKIKTDWSLDASSPPNSFDDVVKFMWYTRRFNVADEALVLEKIAAVIDTDVPVIAERIGKKLCIFLPHAISCGFEVGAIMQLISNNSRYKQTIESLKAAFDTLTGAIPQYCWAQMSLESLISKLAHQPDPAEMIEYILNSAADLAGGQEVILFNFLIEKEMSTKTVMRLVMAHSTLMALLSVQNQIALSQEDGGLDFLKLYFSTIKSFNPVLMDEVLNCSSVTVSCKWYILQVYEDLSSLSPAVLFGIFKENRFRLDSSSKKILNKVDITTDETVYNQLIELSSAIPTEFKIRLFNNKKYMNGELENVLKVKSVKVLYNLVDMAMFDIAKSSWPVKSMVEQCLDQMSNIEALRVLEHIIKMDDSSDELVEFTRDRIISERTTLLPSIAVFDETKSAFAKLIEAIALRSSLCTLDFCRLILCAYNCSLSKSDQILFNAYRAASSTVDASSLRPFLFGTVAVEQWSEETDAKRINEKESRLLLNSLNADRMKATLADFPHFCSVDGTELNISRDDFGEIYDPGFLLRALCDSCRNSVSIDVIQLIKSGALSFVFLSLTIGDSELRSVAVETLSRIKEHSMLYRWSNYNLISSLFHLFELVADPAAPLSGVGAQFFARAAQLLVHPEHEFYQTVMAGVVHMEPFESSIPDFIDYFWATIDQKGKRVWVLNMIHDGITKRSDIKSLFYYHAVEFILASLNGASKDHYLTVLKIISRIARVDPQMVCERGVLNVIKQTKYKTDIILREEEKILDCIREANADCLNMN